MKRRVKFGIFIALKQTSFLIKNIKKPDFIRIIYPKQARVLKDSNRKIFKDSPKLRNTMEKYQQFKEIIRNSRIY